MKITIVKNSLKEIIKDNAFAKKVIMIILRIVLAKYAIIAGDNLFSNIK